jgi:hypothetical protein
VAAANNTKRSLKEIGSSISTVSKLAQTAELRNLGNILGRGFNSAAGEVKALTGELTDYATEVRKLNYLTGAGAEDASRLIQLSDDLAINYGELGTALAAAARKGIDPSTESLAKMSDMYLKLNPGLEQSQFLLDNFGRSGMALAPLLEKGSDAIRKMSADIDKNMLLTDQQVQQMREYELALDDFNDRVQGLRYSVANDLVSAFMALPGPMQDFVLGLNAFGPQITGTVAFVGDLALSLNALGGLFKAGGLLAGFPTQLAAMGTAVRGFGVAIYTAMGPIGWLIAALGLLAGVMVKFGPAALTTFKQLTALAEFKLTGNMPQFAGGFANGGSFTVGGPGGVDKTPVSFMATRGENVTVTPPGRGGGGFQFVYAPTNSFATREEVERAIKPAVENIFRKKGY